jgi:endonuclease G
VSTRIERSRAQLLALEPPLRRAPDGLEALTPGGDERDALEGLPADALDGARRARDAILAGGAPREEDVGGLEALIFAVRPIVDVNQGSFHIPAGEFAHLNRFRRRIEHAIAATGRVEISGERDYAGTAFLVAPRVVMTNRHVAARFARGLGVAVALSSPVAVDLEREIVSAGAGPTMRVTGVAMIHPYWDMALLAVDEDHGRDPLGLLERPAERGTDVVVIGYPFYDERSAAADLDRLYRGHFGVKRLLPGRLGAAFDYPSFGRQVRALKHDASTLGGSSGSPVFDPELDGAVALHFAGEYGETNVGVPAWELLRDERVCAALGLPAPARKAPPAVADAWKETTSRRAAVPAARPRLGVPVRPRRRRGEGLEVLVTAGPDATAQDHRIDNDEARGNDERKET